MTARYLHSGILNNTRRGKIRADCGRYVWPREMATEDGVMNCDECTAAQVARRLAGPAQRNKFITTEEITLRALDSLKNNLQFSTLAKRDYAAEFGSGGKIGQTVTVRKPPRWRQKH